MRPFAVLAAALASAVLGIVVLWPAPPAGPEPLRYGVDACAECRMSLARPGFAGELRDAAGALTTYDDVGCLLRAMLKTRREMRGAWVEDHASHALVPLAAAHLVRGATATPMGFGIVAFADERAARVHAARHRGAVVALEALLHEPERLVRATGGESP
jgi:copper chaperone NosL